MEGKISNTLKITPPIVNFTAIQVNVEYVTTITVQNADLVPHNVRLSRPTNPAFKINKFCTILLASGMEFQFELTFKATKLADYLDTIAVNLESETIEIPIRAYIPKPALILPTFIDFGRVIKGSKITQFMDIINDGEDNGDYTINFSKDLPLWVNPRQGTLMPKMHSKSSHDTTWKQSIQIQLSADNLGPFRSSLTVKLGNGKEYIVDIHATIVERKLEILGDPKRDQINDLQFGSLYFGHKKTIKTVFVNNCPQPSSFLISIPNNDGDGDNNINISDTPPSTRNNLKKTKLSPIKISNKTGLIGPYEEMKVTFTLFIPYNINNIENNNSNSSIDSLNLNSPTKKKQKIESIHYTENILIECPESNQSINIMVVADLLNPLVSLSHNAINFLQCSSSDRRDETITLSNNNSKYPILWETTNIAQFKINPSSGILYPSQKQDIIVSFLPQQLGIFKNIIQFVFEKGILSLPLRLEGECSVVGNKKTYSNVLQSPPKFIMNVEPELQQPYHRKEPWETYHSESVHVPPEQFKGSLEESYTFGLSDHIKNKEFKNKYNQYIKVSNTIPPDTHKLINTYIDRPTKDKKDKKDKDNNSKLFPKDVNIGLTPYDGLDAPLLEIPKKKDKLYLKEPVDGLGRIIGKEVKSVDLTQITPRIYKAVPASPAEAAACTLALNEEQLASIQAGPLLIQFGKITTNSKIVRNFTVFNDLQQSIKINLDFNGKEELSGSIPVCQIIPPGKLAKFDIIFQSSRDQQFEDSIYFIINEKHKMRIKILAIVLPLYLEISRPEIKFSFPPDNLEQYLTELFSLTNPGTTDAEFSWTNQEDEPFQITPKKGIIGSGQTCDFQVQFTPTYKCLSDIIFKCIVSNGKTTMLRCITDDLNSILKVPDKPTCLGLIPVGLPTNVEVRLQNPGPNYTVFYASTDINDIILETKKGRVAPGEFYPLKITFQPTAVKLYGEIETFIKISVRGGPEYVINFSAESKLPEIVIIEDEFAFGQTILGAQARKSINIKNIGDIEVLLLLNLNEYPEFDISDYKLSQFDNKTGINIVKPKTASPNKNENAPSKMYQICIQPEDVIQFSFNFQPTECREHTFELPLSILGIGANSETKRVVTGEGIIPVFVISQGFYDFGKQIVPYDRMKLVPYPHELLLTNKDDKELHWECGDIIMKDIDDPKVFSINPKEGDLLPNDTMKISLEFQPEDSKDYAASIPIYLNHDISRVYTTIETKGKGLYPRLSFNVEEIILPTVPLREKCISQFIIYNHGYDNMEIKFKFPLEGSKLPLNVHFPNGATIGYGTTQVVAQVIFLPTKPISFTTRLDFYDKNGNRFSIMVTGTADNSLLTNYGYIDSYKDTYGIYLDNKNSITLLPLEDIENLKTGKRNKTPAKKDLKSPTRPNSYPSGSNETFLLQFITETLSPTPIQSIDYLVSDTGIWISSFIEYLMGKKLNNKIKNLSQKTDERSNQLLSLYNEILFNIKSYGGLLNHVDPINLLPRDDYIYCKTKKYVEFHNNDYDQQGISELQDKYKEEYFNVSHNSWMLLLYQTVKVFVLNKITVSQYTNLPIINDKRVPESEITSNIYNFGECLLLRWFYQHHKKVHGGLLKKLYSFAEHVRTGSLLCHLLISHVPDLSHEEQPLFNIIDNAKSDFESNSNLEKLIAALKGIRLNFVPDRHFFKHSDDRDILLYILYLYQTLPFYNAKANLLFQGILGQNIEKTIQLSNPTNKLLTYEIEYSGSADYKLRKAPIHIPSNETYDYPISILARFTKPVLGKVIFWGMKSTGISCAPLIFTLESKITSKAPMKIFQTSTPLYLPYNIEITVDNPYPLEGHYDITLNQRFINFDVDNNNNNKNKKNKYNEPISIIKDMDTNEIFDSKLGFYCFVKKININSNSNTKLIIQFLPFYRGKYECDIIFSDIKVGEFNYLITGESLLPNYIEKIRISTDLSSSIQKIIKLNSFNPLLDKAREYVIERYQGNNKTKIRELLKTCNEKLSNIYTPYCVETTNNHCTLPYNMNIIRSDNEYKQMEILSNTTSNNKNDNTLNFVFNPKGSGSYPCQIYIYNGSDYRYYLIDVVVNDKNIKTHLEFTINARQSIVQEIPITNNTEEVWDLVIHLKGDYFTCENKLQIQPNTTSQLHLKFIPEWICDINGDIVIENIKSGEKLYFSLKGIGEEPLYIDKVNLECKAREEIEHIFIVPNPTNRKIKYNIESDIPHISGDNYINVNPNERYQYKLKFKPLLGGKYNGAITFKREDGQYYWYNVNLNVLSPDPDGTIEVKTKAREGSSLSISLSNPLDYPVDLDVILVGKGLIGDNIFHIEANASSVYELLYLVLLPGEQNGSVSFINPDIGEFWYKLHLLAEPADIITLNEMTCSVGTRCSQTISIENPLNEEIELKSKLDNKINFILKPPILTIKPYSTGNVIVEYCPSSVGITESTDFSYSNIRTGDYEYHVDGVGQAPNVMEPLEVLCEIRGSVSKSLLFRNPFPTPLQITVSMTYDSDIRNILYTVIPSKIHSIQPFNILQIPILFSPHQIISYKTMLTITTVNLPNQLTWHYPIIGIGEGVKSELIYRVNCKARTNFSQIWSIDLNNIEIDQPESFNYELQVEDEYKELINKILTIEPILEVLSRPNESLRYKLNIFSYKPLHLEGIFIIKRDIGGQWRYPIIIDVIQSDPDDIIIVNSSLNKISNISFTLNNTYDYDSPFESYFTPESPNNFTIYPHSGILPANNSGQYIDFVISFAPTEYGTVYTGVLLIDTPEMQWVYEIKGQHPDYKKPEGISKLNTKLSPQLTNQLKLAKVVTTNYVNKNITVNKKKK